MDYKCDKCGSISYRTLEGLQLCFDCYKTALHAAGGELVEHRCSCCGEYSLEEHLRSGRQGYDFRAIYKLSTELCKEHLGAVTKLPEDYFIYL